MFLSTEPLHLLIFFKGLDFYLSHKSELSVPFPAAPTGKSKLLFNFFKDVAPGACTWKAGDMFWC